MMEKRFEDLETRMAFQEDLIEKLDAVVAGQQQRIGELEKMLELLVGRYRELAEEVQSQISHKDEPPPHY